MARIAGPVAAAALLAGCATSLPPAAPQLPIHQDRATGREVTRGELYSANGCVLLRAGETPVVPIWPNGTQVTEGGIMLPDAGGATLLRFGEIAYLHGSQLRDMPKHPRRTQPPFLAALACSTHGFLVDRAQTQRQMEAAAPRPPYTSGLLVRRGKCLVLENVDGVLLPVWPQGTQVGERSVVTPNLRGHTPLAVGGRAGITGRYVHADDGSLQRAAGAEAAQCARRGMLVEQANRVYMPNDAAEYAAMSDSVLLVELLGVEPSAPLVDGFLTTVTVRVVEALKGGPAPGQVVRLRHPAGKGPGGHWQVATHDSLFEPFGKLKIANGDRLLLFVNRDLYRQQAEARGGQPAAGHVSASIFKVEGGRIVNDGDIQMPVTVAELRRTIRR